jgi:hypothetical protein
MRETGYSVLVRYGGKLVPFDESIHQTENFFFIPEGHIS